MNASLGITPEGVKSAIVIKEGYRKGDPICMPGEDARILMPENLLNKELDLSVLEGPLALAMMASRDPEAPMALAATTRLGPLGRSTKLVRGVVGLVGETTRHSQVRKCVELVKENAFSPESIAYLQSHTARIIVQTRAQFTAALRHNMRSLLDGEIAPRKFVADFFKLTEAGNMRNDIRKKLVTSLLLSESIRPSIKFIMLENFERMPGVVRRSIITDVLKAKPTHHTEIIKEELRWIVSHDPQYREKARRRNN